MTLKQLAQKTKWGDVRRYLQFYYPEQKKSLPRYKEIFAEIQEMKDKKTDPKEYIDIKRIFDKFEKENSENSGEYYDIATNKYSLSFRPWIDVINLKVRQNNLFNAQIMAHFLWEITYSGFYEKDVQKKGDELFKIVSKAKKEIKIKELKKKKLCKKKK